MSGKSSWMWASLGLLGLLIVAAAVAAYYYSESARYKSLYERAAADLSRFTMSVNILIDYGNDTKAWYNNTVVPRETNVLMATKVVATVEGIEYPGMGTFVTSINGVENRDGKFWMWYIWNSNENRWELGPVASDMYVLREGDTMMWRYEVPTF